MNLKPELIEAIRKIVAEELSKQKEIQEDKKWIQSTDMKKGALKKRLGLEPDEKLSLSKIESELSKLHGKYKEGEELSASDLKLSHELNLAKNLISLHKK